MSNMTITKIMITETVLNDPGIKSYGTTSKEVHAIIYKFLDKLKNSILSTKAGDRIELRGFGTFSIKKRKARMARNPKTGAEVKVPARKAVVFIPGTILKQAIRGK